LQGKGGDSTKGGTESLAYDVEGSKPRRKGEHGCFARFIHSETAYTSDTLILMNVAPHPFEVYKHGQRQ
jgi:hypothetical protein